MPTSHRMLAEPFERSARRAGRPAPRYCVRPELVRTARVRVALLALLLCGCGGGDGNTTATERTGLQVKVTIPSGTDTPAGTTLTVRVQDATTRDDLATARQAIHRAAPVSLVVPDVPQGIAAVVRAVLSNGAASEVLSGETAVASVSRRAPVAVSLAPLDLAAASAAWVSYGPAPLYSRIRSNVSGRASAILVDPTNPARIFVGAATGGVWYSANGGADWKCLTDHIGSNSIGSLAFDPSDPTYKTIYVGTGETIPSGQYGAGIFRVTEDGQIALVAGSDILTGKSISRIVPLADGTLFVGVYELHVPGFEGDGSFGVFVRRPGETTFSNSFIPSLEIFGPPDLPITALLVREVSGGPPRLLAAVDNWSTDDLSYSSGLYTSLDGGGLWEKTDIYDANGNSLIDRYDVARISLAASPSNPDIVYALVGSHDGTFQGAFVSTDFGNTWVTITTSPDVPSIVSYEVNQHVVGQSRYNSAVAVDPLDAHTCYVSGTRPGRISNVDFTTGSADGFELGTEGSLQDSDHPHVDHHGLLALATSSGSGMTTSLYDVSDGGVWMLPNATTAVAATKWINLNGGNTWLQTLQYYSVAVDPNDHTRLYGGAQDNGSSTTVDKNFYWTQLLGGDGGHAAYDAQTKIGYVTYAYSESSLYTVGQVKQEVDGHYTTHLTESRGLRTGEAGMFIPPLLLHPVDGRLALGTVRVYESTDGGDDWTDISGKLSDEGVISAMAYHPKNPKILYVAESNTDIFRTTDGSNFDNIYQSNVPERPISAIAVDATDAKGDHAWVAQSSFVSPSDSLGQIFQTVDGGQRWTDFSGGLPNLPVWSLVQCTDVTPNLLFAGTDDGVYVVVLDGKSSWMPFGTGLPTVQVRSLQLAHRKQSGALFLVAATYGRAVYEIPVSGAAPTAPTLGTPADVDAPDIPQEADEEENGGDRDRMSESRAAANK